MAKTEHDRLVDAVARETEKVTSAQAGAGFDKARSGRYGSSRSGGHHHHHLHHSSRKSGRFKRTRSFFQTLKKRPWTFVGLIFSFAALLIALYSALIPRFALAYSDTIAHFLRVMLGNIFSAVPFSAGEVLFILFCLFLIVWLIVLTCALIRKYRDKERPRRKVRRMLWTPVYILWVAALLFSYLFFPSYMRPSLPNTLELNYAEITDKDLYATLNFFVAEINSDAKLLNYGPDGASVMDLSFTELANEINNDYIRTNELIPRIVGSGSPAKPFSLSPLLLQFHLSGVFTFYTGEANVNTAYPDFILPYTAAHEAAHQRGIARENDATLAGFIACSNSENPYVRYSGYLNLLCEMLPEINEYLNELYDSDPEFARELAENVQGVLDRLDPRIRGELNAYSEFFTPYRDSHLAEIAEDLNDSYLKAQGQSDGILSYRNLTSAVVQYYTMYLK